VDVGDAKRVFELGDFEYEWVVCFVAGSILIARLVTSGTRQKTPQSTFG
jgi:hypothetical protein